MQMVRISHGCRWIQFRWCTTPLTAVLEPLQMQWQIQDFPLGGANLQHVHFLVKTYAKMKEMDPVWGRTCQRHPLPLDLPMRWRVRLQDWLHSGDEYSIAFKVNCMLEDLLPVMVTSRFRIIHEGSSEILQ